MLYFLFILLELFFMSQALTLVKENSLTGPYVAGGENLWNWDLTGSAELDILGGKYIRLTTDEGDKNGAIWNNFPCFHNNWEFQVEFNIHGKSQYLHGDGMALWYVHEEDRLKTGTVFGSKDYFRGLGVFIDTFPNQDPYKQLHPYIYAMVNNGSIHYAHEEDGSATRIGGCHAVLTNLAVPTRIAVSYINNALTVYIDVEGLNMWKLCFKSEGVFLPTGYFLGISASTSVATDNHDVIAAATLNIDPEDKEWIDNSNVIPTAESIEIPQKYHKEFIEAEMQKVHLKREVKEETRKADRTKSAYSSSSEEILAPPSTSLFRKLVYLTGCTLIILVSISMYRNYSERRRERMEKRLY